MKEYRRQGASKQNDPNGDESEVETAGATPRAWMQSPQRHRSSTPLQNVGMRRAAVVTMTPHPTSIDTVGSSRVPCPWLETAQVDVRKSHGRGEWRTVGIDDAER